MVKVSTCESEVKSRTHTIPVNALGHCQSKYVTSCIKVRAHQNVRTAAKKLLCASRENQVCGGKKGESKF